jgi:hypothetical protein
LPTPRAPIIPLFKAKTPIAKDLHIRIAQVSPAHILVVGQFEIV